ncbi:MAG TPA: hypothetical protein VFU41_06445 [Gemmatimonadales bacterium]|nr:hypothetical protein [Gemmatimonadales bacterium]
MIQGPPGLPPGTMDPNFLVSQVIPLIGVIAVVIVAGLVLKGLFRSPVGDAWAERIRAGMHRRKHWKGLGGEWVDAPAGADDRRVAVLEEQVSHLQVQVSELAERLDFAERMLAERRERKLGAGQ